MLRQRHGRMDQVSHQPHQARHVGRAGGVWIARFVAVALAHSVSTFVLSSPNWLITRTATRLPCNAGIGCERRP